MIYWDTSYLAKIYLREPGSDVVLRAFEKQGGLVCAEHGRLELMATFKRHERENRLTAVQVKLLWRKHDQDLANGLIQYLPLRTKLIEQACETLAFLPPALFLRAADALHLTCAAEAGFKQIYSHDRHLLAAAFHFDLKGIDVITA